MTPRARLMIAAALFVGWLGWLGVTALTKSRAPVVSRTQAAAAAVVVVAELTAGEEGAPAKVVTVVESLTPGAPVGEIVVLNLPESRGFTGSGRYLLLLNKDTLEGGPSYRLAGLPPSPGMPDLTRVGPWIIYPWSDETADDLRKQVKNLFP